MKKKVQNFLLTVDVYGAPFQFNFKKNSPVNKSKLGGAYTILLVIAVLIYGITKLTSWFQGEFLPTRASY